MRKHAIGIDLSTTFSKVTVLISDIQDLVADQTGNKSIPSMVYFSKVERGTQILVGNYAKNKQIRFPNSTIYDTKRMLGKQFDDENIQKMIKKWPFKIEKSTTGSILVCLDEIGEKWEPYKISSEILKYLAELGNSRLPKNEKTNDVVITVPANFHEEQRAETYEAAKYAGLNVLTLLNEPTAAGLAFGQQNQNSGSKNVFVFDFGGGTLDVSLLQINNSKITVKATDGDMFLGGRDFDEKTAEYLLRNHVFGDTFQQTPKNLLKLIKKVSKAKIELSASNQSVIYLNDSDDQGYTLSLSLFEEINRDLIDRILLPVDRLLQTTKTKKDEIDSIIVVGGSSNMNFVKRKLTEYFNKEPFRGLNSHEAVAFGAGIIAAKMIKDENLPARISNIEFHDICPYSIGTSGLYGEMVIVIPKNTPIPTQKVVKEFQTIFYRQEDFYVDVLEGESHWINENVCIGGFTIPNLPISENILHFNLSFYLDQNSILNVEAELVEGELKEKTKIDIKKRKSNQVKNKNKLDQIDPQFIEFEIFNKNLKRFIQFNLNKLLTLYTNDYLNKILRQIQYSLKHIDEQYTEVASLSDHFQDMFKEYFANNTVPEFFRC